MMLIWETADQLAVVPSVNPARPSAHKRRRWRCAISVDATPAACCTARTVARPWVAYIAGGFVAAIALVFLMIGLAIVAIAVAVSSVALTVCVVVLRDVWRDVWRDVKRDH